MGTTSSNVHEVKGTSEEIVVIFQGKKYLPENESTNAKVHFSILEELEYEPFCAVEVSWIECNLVLEDENGKIEIEIKFDTSNSYWEIEYTEIEKINEYTFPHVIDVNIDTKKIFVHFDVYS